MLNQRRAFSGEYAFMSNMTKVSVVYEGIEYQSTENAYQAAKTVDLELRETIRQMEPIEAKKASRKLLIRSDWDEVKYDIMYDLQKQKYSNEDFKRQLLATGDMELVEYNYWHDNYWGSCTCPRCNDNGKNMLGKILMEIRALLRDS